MPDSARHSSSQDHDGPEDDGPDDLHDTTPEGIASRLRRFDLGSKGFSNETTLFESPTGLFDNLEGVSIWRDSKGRLTATMVSDNNMTIFLRTEIVEFRLPD